MFHDKYIYKFLLIFRLLPFVPTSCQCTNMVNIGYECLINSVRRLYVSSKCVNHHQYQYSILFHFPRDTVRTIQEIHPKRTFRFLILLS